MRTDEAYAAVAAAIAEIAPEADLASVAGGRRMRDELDLDSIDFLSLVQRLCDTTGVDIPESDYGAVGTLDELVAYVAARAEGAPSAASRSA